MNKIKTIIKNPTWSFIGVILTILFGQKTSMITHIFIQDIMTTIALFLVAYGLYGVWKQKDIKTKKEEPLLQKPSNPFEKDKNIGWRRNPATGEALCSKCFDEHKYAIPLDKDITGLFKICPRCKTMYALSFGELMKEDFTKNLNTTATNKGFKKKAMRVSILK